MTDAASDHQHDHGAKDHKHDPGVAGADGPPWRMTVVTVSSSRDAAADRSGSVACEAIDAAGHEVASRTLVADDEDAIRSTLREAIGETDVVVTSGGTGLTRDDVTIEAVRSLLRTELPGVGEYFRRLSHEQIGTSAMLSRATAGVVDGTAIFAFPGSPDAVELGVERVLLPEIDHFLHLARR